jgi:hypothetical protein
MHLPNCIRYLERHTINSNPRFATDLRTAGAEGSLLLVAAYSPPRPRPRVDLGWIPPPPPPSRRCRRWIPPLVVVVRGVVHVAPSVVWRASQRKGVRASWHGGR